MIDAHVAQGLRAWGVHGAQLSCISVTHVGLLATGAVSRHQSVGSLPLLATSSTLCMCFCNTCAVSVHQLLAALWAALCAASTGLVCITPNGANTQAQMAAGLLSLCTFLLMQAVLSCSGFSGAPLFAGLPSAVNCSGRGCNGGLVG